MEKKLGFSLIELMVVVAIITFLAGITIPRYKKYLLRAKAAEVAVLLTALHTAQQLYWSEHGAYTPNIAKKLQLNTKNTDCTYGFHFPGARKNVHYVVGKNKTPPEKLGTCYANKDHFLARAASGERVWSIDESRTITLEKK